MATIKKKSSGGGGANWMDTYGDMVTLLLCFFVLLYSMSTIDQQKWAEVVKSFNPDILNDLPASNQTDLQEEPTVDEVKQALEALYTQMSDFAETSNATVSVSKGDGYVFISFNDAVFFDGDSYTLRADGRAALDGIVPALVEASPYIDELRVLGHTAQATADHTNDPAADRFLASNRATEVLLYLQENIGHDKLDPARIVSMGYGQWRPIAANETAESRVQNRRVELIIAGRGLDSKLADSVKQYYSISNQNPPAE